MTAPIALQLYTLRDQLHTDFEGIVRRVADIGYAGVEPFGAVGTHPDEAALFHSLGLEVPSMHVPLLDEDNHEEIAGWMASLHSPRVVSGLGPDHFQTLDQIRRSCDRFNRAAHLARQHGLGFGIHNHWWEFELVEGQRPYQFMREHLDPDIFWEIDTYWVRTAGLDPVKVLQELGAAAPLLHIKDGPAEKGVPMVAVGEGSLDFPGIVRASAAHVHWLIVELDACATDMMAAVTRSYNYLVREGLGHGRPS